MWLMYNNVLMGRHVPIVRDKVPRLFIPVVMATAARALEVGRRGRSGETRAVVAVSLWKIIRQIFASCMENTPSKPRAIASVQFVSGQFVDFKTRDKHDSFIRLGG